MLLIAEATVLFQLDQSLLYDMTLSNKVISN